MLLVVMVMLVMPLTAAARGGKARRGGRAAAGDFLDGIQSYQNGPTRVQAYPAFISEAETAELLELAGELTSESRPDADREYDGVSDQTFFRRGFFSDRWRGEEHPLINQLWERASRLTMIPEHDGDSWLKYHVETSWKKPMLRNIHHDRADGREGRVLTLLVYLSNVRNGGHTVFPCIGPDGGPPADQGLCDTFVEAYGRGKRTLAAGGPGGWNTTAFKQVWEGCAAAASAVGRSTMLSVKPSRGMAVLFPSAQYGGQAMPEMWHSGCPVIDGEKHAIQFFREAPP